MSEDCLDEPSSSLDPVARQVLWSWLREHKTNRTLLISSHLLDEVEELCDSVIILDSGKVRAQGTILELKRQFGPPGDRLVLDTMPSYIPPEWIVNEQTRCIQVPERGQLIRLLERLERDQIKYSLSNITLDDIFLKLTSTSESIASDESTVKAQIATLFGTKTVTQPSRLWSQQILGVVIRRARVFLRRARLLPVIVLLYLAYALAPLYMPSFESTPVRSTRYVVSAPAHLIGRLSLKARNMDIAPSFISTRDFQNYLLGLRTRPSDTHLYETIVGLRIPSNDNLECYVPSPVVTNILASCVPQFSALTNSSFIPMRFNYNQTNSPLLAMPSLSSPEFRQSFYCFHTLPPGLHLTIVILSLILIICAALTIQDHASGLHSYSLIHGLRSPIHWLITYLTDLLLCLFWLAILILIARFVHSNTFDGQFFALAPLFFVVNLPFIYLLAKFFTAPILGATMVMFLLQVAHVLYTFRVLVELFRGYRALSTLIPSFDGCCCSFFPT